MARRKPARPVVQPGALDTSLQKDVFYKVPRHMELQRLKGTEDAQLALRLEKGLDGQELQDAVEVSGLDLSIPESRARHAVQLLLSQTEHKGNEPGRPMEAESFKWSGILPVLTFTRSAFFEAYGLSRKGDGSYYGHQAEEALKALHSLLTTPRHICYTRTTWSGDGKDRKARREAVVYHGSLGTIAEPFRDLTEEEQDALQRGEDVPRRSTGLTVIFGPAFVDGLDTFYVLKPASGYKELLAALPEGKRVSPAHYNFADWLQLQDQAEVDISTDKLLKRLWLDRYLKQRKRSKALDILREVLDTAVRSGSLLSYEERTGQLGQEVLHLQLNPEKIGKLKAKAEPDVEVTEEASDG